MSQDDDNINYIDKIIYKSDNLRIVVNMYGIL